MRTTILLGVLGATLIASLTVQMAAASEHHARKSHLSAVERYREQQRLCRARLHRSVAVLVGRGQGRDGVGHRRSLIHSLLKEGSRKGRSQFWAEP